MSTSADFDCRCGAPAKTGKNAAGALVTLRCKLCFSPLCLWHFALGLVTKDDGSIGTAPVCFPICSFDFKQARRLRTDSAVEYQR